MGILLHLGVFIFGISADIKALFLQVGVPDYEVRLLKPLLPDGLSSEIEILLNLKQNLDAKFFCCVETS